MATQEELKKALSLISLEWGRQNNRFDKRSNFISRVETVDECLQKAREMAIDENYVLHRWYNYQTSIYCEGLFVKYGAQKEKQLYNHDIDIYINEIPYDVKLTVYPAKLKRSGEILNLHNRDDKNTLIRWMYANQSQEGRKHLKNRMFIVCNGENTYQNLALKSDFDIIETRISGYFHFLENNEPNKLVIQDAGQEYEVYSDIISIEK